MSNSGEIKVRGEPVSAVPMEVGDTGPAESELSPRVVYYEPVAFAIVRELQERGFVPCGCTGLGPPSRDYIGILELRPPVTERFLFLKWSSPQRPVFPAVLWLNNSIRRASEKERWVVEVHGRRNIDRMTELISEIARSCGAAGITVEVQLGSECLRQPTIRDLDPHS